MTQNYAQPNQMAVNSLLSNSSTFECVGTLLEVTNECLLKSLQNDEVAL